MNRDWRNARDPLHPEPGFWLVAMVAKGWKVPALLTLEDGLYRLTLDGETLDRTWTEGQVEGEVVDWLTAHNPSPLARLIMFGQPTTEAEYEHRLSLKAWAREHSPGHPCLTPNRPMNRALMSFPTF